METTKQFLTSVYTSIKRRQDSYLELGLALASADYIDSVVGLSESPLYRRKFSSVYDSLDQVSVDEAGWLDANLALFEETCDELEGHEVYSGDSTFDKRSEAQTLEGRVMKRLASGELVYGYESYWTTRLSQQANSWTGVALVERLAETDTVTKLAARHMTKLDAQGQKPKLFVFDAGHGLDLLETQQACQQSDLILRLKSHQVFYDEAPDYKGRGRPAKHGQRFKLSDEYRQADHHIVIDFKNKPLRISTWVGFHARKFPDVPIQLLKLEFLNDENKPIFEKPIWLLTTALKLDVESIARAYLWRSSHELSFRFMKQHLGLTQNQSPASTNADHWYQLVAFAMNSLLAIRDSLTQQPRPWYPQKDKTTVSQRQAQKQAQAFFSTLATITRPCQPAGKALGRSPGYRPPPRIRHPVKRKTPQRSKACPTCPFQATA